MIEWDAGADVTESALSNLVAQVKATRSNETLEGASDEFDMKLRSEQFEIEDVFCDYCAGAYGTAYGRHATFLAGVDLPLVFTIRLKWRTNVIRGIRVNDGGIGEYEIASGNRFQVNVGRFSPGAKMEVQAICEDDGGELVYSPPFRVNLDVAEKPWVFGIGEIGFEIDGSSSKATWKKGGLTFEIGQEKGTDESPWWLPNGRTSVKPFLAMSATYSPENATFTLMPSLWRSQKDDTWVGITENGVWGHFLGTSLGLKADGLFAIRWNGLVNGWLVDHAGLKGTISIKAISWSYPFVIPTPIGTIPMYTRVEVEGEMSASVIYHGDNTPGAIRNESNWEWTFESDKIPRLSGSLGLGHATYLYGEGTLAGSGIMFGRVGGPAAEEDYGVYMTVGGAVGYGRDRWWGKRFSISYDFDPWWLIGDGQRTTPVRAASRLAVADALSADVDVTSPKMASRTAMATRMTAGTDARFAPIVSTAGDCLFRAWMIDGDDALNEWAKVFVQCGAAEAESVWDDGTPDFAPTLGAAPDGTAVLAWMNAARALGEDEDFVDVMRAMEIAVAVRDSATGEWSATNLTSDISANLSAIWRTLAYFPSG